MILMPVPYQLTSPMSINVDLNDLQAFRAVVENGSFRKAVESVRIRANQSRRSVGASKSLSQPST